MNSTSTDTSSFNYAELGYQGFLLLVVVINLIASLSVHFRFKSICESDVFKRVSSISKMLQSPQIPQTPQNSTQPPQSSI